MTQAKTHKFFGSEFKMVTAWGSGNPISAITNASPPVVTDTSHGISVGAYVPVLIQSVGGMTEINDRAYIALGIDANTYSLVGVDATNWGTYTSGGTWKLGTLSTNHCEEVGYTSSSGETPVTEEETVCGITTNTGAPRMGTVGLEFKLASNAFQEAIENNRLAGTETVLMVQVKNYPKKIFDIGIFTSNDMSGSAGGTWSGSTSMVRTQQQIKVPA